MSDDADTQALGEILANLYLAACSPDARAYVAAEWDRIQQERPACVAFDMGAFLDRMDTTLRATR